MSAFLAGAGDRDMRSMQSTLRGTMRGLPPLTVWNRGDPLNAQDLNNNFMLLVNMVGQAAHAAMQSAPDAADALALAVSAHQKLAAIEGEVQALDEDLGEYAPMIAVLDLHRQFSATMERATRAVDTLEWFEHQRSREHARMAARVSELKDHQAPPAPSVEAFNALREEMAKAQTAAQAALRQLESVQAEVQRLRKQVTDPDRGRQANQRMFTPLATTAELFKRVQELEAPHKEAQEAREESKQLREELGRAKQELADQDARQYREHSAMLYELLRKIERLEGGK